MQPIQLIVEHRLDQQGNPIAEVSGLPRLGALLYPDQMQQLGRQLIQAAIVAQQGERGTRLYPAEDRTMTEQQACTLCGAGWHTAANCIWNGSEKGLALAQRIDKNLDERAQFESWVRREWPGAPLHHVRDALPVNDPRYGEYCNENIQRGWVGWQARAALAQPSPAPELERGSIHVEARECIGCGHSGINDAADGFATCSACAWIGKEPVKDECPKCQRENVMAAACPMCHCRYILIADGHIKAPVGQAGQVPDGCAPGTYAIDYRDNWDGEGDRYFCIAEKTADGKWIRQESGQELLEYKGDAILAAWLLAASEAQERDK
ncbi:hypothetical protein [Pseudomonas sp. PI1]|uniref:hypothetical protein n=1 Tax=Pseudomonas sp. PI1 TaxID=1582493 RepID=UPI0005B8A28C|nr:hypothetical protein [Pseudomonas sp. PI1]KWR82510.1 hypothetical protein RN02_08885 [Pseudomonas sp. PI1]